MTITVLITRPDSSGLALADQLRNRWGCGVRLVLSPVLKIVQTGSVLDLQGIQRLIFTSQHGITAFAQFTDRRDIPCVVVGPATAQFAQSAGFTVLHTEGDADALADRIVTGESTGPYLHIRGEYVASDLRSRLNAAGHPTTESVMYKQIAQPLNGEAKNCLVRENPVILPLYSPRSAEIVFNQINATAPVLVAAISSNVAAKVVETDVNSLNIAHRPDSEAMMEVMDDLLEQAKLLEGVIRAQ